MAVSGRLAFYSTLLVALMVAFAFAIGFFRPFPVTSLYPDVAVANISGFAALFLIGVSGVMMFFRTPIVRMTRNSDALRDIHILVAALGGFFLLVHVTILLLFPLSLPVLVGYLGSYIAFMVWITGSIFLEGFRSSLYFHGLLSLVAVSLIVVHVFTAGGFLSGFSTGIVLAAVAVVILVGALKELSQLGKDRPPSPNTL